MADSRFSSFLPSLPAGAVVVGGARASRVVSSPAAVPAATEFLFCSPLRVESLSSSAGCVRRSWGRRFPLRAAHPRTSDCRCLESASALGGGLRRTPHPIRRQRAALDWRVVPMIIAHDIIIAPPLRDAGADRPCEKSRFSHVEKRSFCSVQSACVSHPPLLTVC